jgi:hypothetical protein
MAAADLGGGQRGIGGAKAAEIIGYIGIMK